jgi:hypothetical protein
MLFNIEASRLANSFLYGAECNEYRDCQFPCDNCIQTSSAIDTWRRVLGNKKAETKFSNAASSSTNFCPRRDRRKNDMLVAVP